MENSFVVNVARKFQGQQRSLDTNSTRMRISVFPILSADVAQTTRL